MLSYMQKIISMKVERIAHDGAAETLHDGLCVRVHGMLPEEEGVVEITKKRKIYEGTLKELTRASVRRKTPEELHYLSCSPWQVMEYPLQAELKHDLLVSLFGYYDDAPKSSFVPAEQFFGYRTKVEYSFTDRNGAGSAPLSLAFHVRGGGNLRIALHEGCALASEGMNRVALSVCARLRDEGYVARDLKTLVVRESKSTGKFIAILFAKNSAIAEFPVSDIPNLSGFIAFHSTEKSPASVPTEELWRWGDASLEESVDGLRLRYSWNSFFQNNIPMFVRALALMRAHIAPDARILELYSGVGTIGLALANDAKEVRGVETIVSAVESANANAHALGLVNYSTIGISAEKMEAKLMDGINVIVLDPPRAGLHPKVIGMLRTACPAQIIYLSCNPETQARDYALLSDLYRIDRCTGFDFYPQTPHLESLLVLSLRKG